jgi:hypothetical protein
MKNLNRCLASRHKSDGVHVLFGMHPDSLCRGI